MQGCFETKINEQSKYDIDCSIIPKYSQDEIPQEQCELYVEIENVSSIIKSLINTDDSIKDEYFKKLLTLAGAGLSGPNAQPLLAMESLKALKQDMLIKEGGRIKNKYMISLGIVAFSFFMISNILILVFNYMQIYAINKYIYTFSGAMIGTWISFGARKVELKFEELSVIEKDRLNPTIRLMFVGLSSVILILFINSGIVEFSVGGLSSHEINSSIELQVLMGIMSGLVENKLAVGLFNKANDIVKL